MGETYIRPRRDRSRIHPPILISRSGASFLVTGLFYRKNPCSVNYCLLIVYCDIDASRHSYLAPKKR